MQLNFSKITMFTPEWNGNKELPTADQVKVKITVCEMGKLLQAVDAFKEAGAGETMIDTESLDQDSIKGLVEATADLLPAHIEIQNLKDEGGNELTGDDVVKYGALFALAAEILAELIRVSTPSEEDEKN